MSFSRRSWNAFAAVTVAGALSLTSIAVGPASATDVPPNPGQTGADVEAPGHSENADGAAGGPTGGVTGGSGPEAWQGGVAPNGHDDADPDVAGTEAEIDESADTTGDSENDNGQQPDSDDGTAPASRTTDVPADQPEPTTVPDPVVGRLQATGLVDESPAVDPGAVAAQDEVAVEEYEALRGELAAESQEGALTRAALPIDQDLFQRVNAARTSAGLAKVLPNARLGVVANQLAVNMKNAQNCSVPNTWGNAIQSGDYRWYDAVVLYSCGDKTPERVIREFLADRAIKADINNVMFDRIGVSYFSSFMGNYNYGKNFVIVLGDAMGFPSLDVYATFGVKAPVWADKYSTANPVQYAGNTRYETSYLLNKDYMKSKAPLFVVSGADFPDALSAGPAAAKVGGDLLAVAPSSIPVHTINLIKQKAPTRIYVIGGPAIVGNGVYGQLSAAVGGKIERIMGSNRLETSRMIMDKFFPAGGTAYVATGWNYPDALAGAVLAGQKKAPILLVNGGARANDDWAVTKLKASKRANVTIFGGWGAVSDQLLNKMKTAGLNPKRLNGDNRYTTSLAIAKQVTQGWKPATVGVATGTHYADALSASAVSARNGWPLVLGSRTCLNSQVASWMKSSSGQRIAYGGRGVLTESGWHQLMVCQ